MGGNLIQVFQNCFNFFFGLCMFQTLECQMTNLNSEGTNKCLQYITEHVLYMLQRILVN